MSWLKALTYGPSALFLFRELVKRYDPAKRGKIVNNLHALAASPAAMDAALVAARDVLRREGRLIE